MGSTGERASVGRKTVHQSGQMYVPEQVASASIAVVVDLLYWLFSCDVRQVLHCLLMRL